MLSFSLGWCCSPPPVQYYRLLSIVLQAQCYSPLNLFITSTGNSHKIWLKSYLAGLVFFPVFFSLSLNFTMRSWWSEPQSAPGLIFFSLYTVSPSSATKKWNQFDFNIDHLMMSICKAVFCLAFAFLHFHTKLKWSLKCFFSVYFLYDYSIRGLLEIVDLFKILGTKGALDQGF